MKVRTSNGTRNLRNAKLSARKVLHLCCRWAIGVTSRVTDNQHALSPTAGLTILCASSRHPFSQPVLTNMPQHLCMPARTAFWNQKGSHFHSKTVDTQRYTISPVCKLQLCFYLYLIFIQQILTEHLPYARHCSRCRGYSSDESETIFMDLNSPDLLCDLIYDTQYHPPYVAASCVFFSSKLHEGKEAPSFIYIVSFSTETDSAVRNLA